MFRLFCLFTLKEQLPASLTPATQQTRSPSAPPHPHTPLQPAWGRSLVSSRRTGRITPLSSHNVCQRTVRAPKVDDCSKSGVCVADERYENICFAHYHPESRRGEHLLRCDLKMGGGGIPLVTCVVLCCCCHLCLFLKTFIRPVI